MYWLLLFQNLVIANEAVGSQAMLFLNFSTEQFDAFKSKYHEVAELYKGKELSFLLGDVEASQGAFQVGIYLHLVLNFLLILK